MHVVRCSMTTISNQKGLLAYVADVESMRGSNSLLPMNAYVHLMVLAKVKGKGKNVPHGALTKGGIIDGYPCILLRVR